MNETTQISIDDVALIISDLGYDVDRRDGLLIIMAESGMRIAAVLNDEVVVFSTNLIKIDGSISQFIAKNPATVANMLTGSHDVNSKFILSESDGKVLINLTDKVKLLSCGEDDKDDIGYVLSSLEQDALIDSREALEALI